VSAETAAFYQAGIRCDHAGCNVSIWRVAPSRELATTNVQAAAKEAGWGLAPDRLHAHRDMCPEHTTATVESVHRMIREAQR
jgi:hypothetical protein